MSNQIGELYLLIPTPDTGGGQEAEQQQHQMFHLCVSASAGLQLVTVR